MVERREMTVREAGKLGGDAVKEKYGPEFFSKIGKKGALAKAKAEGRFGSPIFHRSH